MDVNDITLTLQIWDTAGDKKMLSIGKSLYKNADGIILVYDITSRASFRSLDMYWDNFLKHSGTDEAEFFPAVLVGNKSDLSAKRDVSLEEVIEWCTNRRPQKQITYLECSAKLNIGVKVMSCGVLIFHFMPISYLCKGVCTQLTDILP